MDSFISFSELKEEKSYLERVPAIMIKKANIIRIHSIRDGTVRGSELFTWTPTKKLTNYFEEKFSSLPGYRYKELKGDTLEEIRDNHPELFI